MAPGDAGHWFTEIWRALAAHLSPRLTWELPQDKGWISCPFLSSGPALGLS
jgi:hypothetical protein